MAGDVNIHCETNNAFSKRLQSLLSNFNLMQNITEPTNNFGHTVDVVISPVDAVPLSNISVNDMSLSDHYLDR